MSRWQPTPHSNKQKREILDRRAYRAQWEAEQQRLNALYAAQPALPEAQARAQRDARFLQWRATLALYAEGVDGPCSCGACDRRLGGGDGGGYTHRKFSQLRYCGSCLRRDLPGGDPPEPEKPAKSTAAGDSLAK